MAGINFGAIGTALGGFFDGYDKAKLRGQRDQLYQQEQQDRQRKERSAKLFFDQVRLPGGSGLQSPGGGSAPGQAAFGGGGAATQAPAAGYAPEEPAAGPSQSASIPPQYSPAPQGSGFSSGLPRGEIATNNFAGMRQPGVPAAGGPMTNPSGWQRFATPEAGVGGISRQLDRYASGATTGKPLTTLRQIVSTWAPPNENATDQLIQRVSQSTGFQPDQPLDVSNPQVKAQLVSALIRNEQGGRMPVSPDVIERGIAGGAQAGGSGGGGPATALQGIPANDPLRQQAQQTGRNAMQGVDPSVYGKMSIEAIARRIDQAAPNEDPVVKMMALEATAKLLAPDQRERWEMFKQQNEQAFRRELAAEQDKRLIYREDKQDDRADKRERAAAERAASGGPIIETDKGPMRIAPGSSKATPIDIGDAHVVGAKGGEGAPANIIAFDKEGKRIFEGNARPTPNGWVNTATGETIAGADRVESTGKGVPGAGGGGGRGGAQVQRQVIAAREIQSDLENVAKLPITTNRGIFGGRHQGPGLLDALKENLAEAVTPEDAELTASALSGLERELSIVTSPVYGGKWAAQSFNALQIKPGQTYLVKLYNLARMRQTADNALEGVINTDWVGAQQKDFAKLMREGMAKAIPWTPSDVLAFREQPKDTETFQSFVKKNKIGDGGKQGGAQETEEINPETGEAWVYRDGKWQPKGPAAQGAPPI